MSLRTKSNISQSSKGISIISSPEESLISQSNYTTRFYEDRPSHHISDYTAESDSLFNVSNLKTYEDPVDSSPILKPVTKELQRIQEKLKDFKSLHKPQPSLRPQSKSPLSRSKSDKSSISALTPITTLPSHKKPMLSLTVNFSGKIVSEDIYNNEFSYEIAKRVFTKAGISPSQKNLKDLTDLIESEVNGYMREVSVELQKYQREAKMIEEKHAKQRLEKFKPPLLATERRAIEKRAVLGNVTINVNNENIIVPIKEGDIPEKVAAKICLNKNVPQEYRNNVLNAVRDFIDRSNKKFLFRLEFDVGGKIVDLAVHEGDDLLTLAQKFVRENKLGRENISKIEGLLNKQIKTIY